jgi:hypothetical protein
VLFVTVQQLIPENLADIPPGRKLRVLSLDLNCWARELVTTLGGA